MASDLSPCSTSSSSSVPIPALPNSLHLRTHLPDYAKGFLNEFERRQMEESASRCGNVVCQVLTQDKERRGTGCLIGPVLLLTNHHVLPDVESAKSGFACFFRVVSQDRVLDQEKSRIETIKITLDPDSFFFTSPNEMRHGEPQPPSKDHLDFTVVALKPVPYLSSIQNSVLSIFDNPPLSVNTPICLIQHPEEMGAEDVLKGDLKWSYGQIREITGCSIVYNAPTSGGSSGGPVIDYLGRLVALHHQVKSIPNHDQSIVLYDHLGVAIKEIALALKEQWERMEEIKRTRIPEDLGSRRVIGLPPTTATFTGRDQMLAELEKACSGEGKRVAVVGRGGVGKTALTVKYANDHQSDYSLICFIPSGTKAQIENGLLNLPAELRIQEENLERRLLALKRKLKTNQERFLLIFDGVDDEETLAYVCDLLPQRGCTTLLVSSRFQGSAENPDFVPLPLTIFTPEESIAFLLKAAGQKDTDANQAALLAEELGYLPLALKHAAAFIRSTDGYTYKKYLEELRSIGVTLLGPGYVPKQGTREETILTTWKNSMDAILQAPHGHLAAKLLYTFSLFAEAPIPAGIVEQFTSPKEEDRKTAINQLINYSLLDQKENCYVLHGLLQKVIQLQLGKTSGAYILRGLQKLTDFVRKVDPNDPPTRRLLDPYIPHLETILESAKVLPPMHSAKIDTLLVTLVNYYFCDGKERDYKRISEKGLKHFNKRELAIRSMANNATELENHYRNVGALYDHLGRYEEALTCDKRALRICKWRLGVAHPATADSYREVGVALGNLGRHEEALPYKQRALKIRKQKLGLAHPSTAESYGDVGVTLGHLGTHEEALTYLQQSLEIRKEKLGQAHPDTANTYFCIGATLSNLGRLKEALTHLQRSLEIRQQTLGEAHPDTADTYFCVGITLGDLGRHEQALTYLQRALEIRNEKLGDTHPDTAQSYRNVGVTLGLLGSLEEALTYLQRSLEIRKQTLGEEHPDTADSYFEVGATLSNLDRFREALTYAKRALEIRKQKLGEAHPDTSDSYLGVGVTLGHLGSHKEALPYKQRALEIRKQKFGKAHPDTADSYFEVGATLSNLGRLEEALTYARRALKIRKQKLGEAHPDTADSYLGVGVTLGVLCKHEEALFNISRCLEIRTKILGENHPDTLKARRLLEVLNARRL